LARFSALPALRFARFSRQYYHIAFENQARSAPSGRKIEPKRLIEQILTNWASGRVRLQCPIREIMLFRHDTVCQNIRLMLMAR